MNTTFTKVVSSQTGTVFEIDESCSLADMERSCPLFFKNRHGKRETYGVHRGCLIVRYTVQFTGCKPHRNTVVYIHCRLEGRMDMFCVSVGSDCYNIQQAKRLINRLLDGGTYSYGFFKE